MSDQDLLLLWFNYHIQRNIKRNKSVPPQPLSLAPHPPSLTSLSHLPPPPTQLIPLFPPPFPLLPYPTPPVHCVCAQPGPLPGAQVPHRELHH